MKQFDDICLFWFHEPTSVIGNCAKVPDAQSFSKTAVPDSAACLEKVQGVQLERQGLLVPDADHGIAASTADVAAGGCKRKHRTSMPRLALCARMRQHMRRAAG